MIVLLQKSNSLLDEPVPNINIDILQPTAVPAPEHKAYDRTKNNLITMGKKIKSEAYDFADWLVDYVPPPLKAAVNKSVIEFMTKVNNIFSTVHKNVDFKNVKPKRKFEVQKAICGNVQKYTIDGVVGNDAKSFLDEV